MIQLVTFFGMVKWRDPFKGDKSPDLLGDKDFKVTALFITWWVFFQGDLGRHSGKGKGLNLTPSFATKALPPPPPPPPPRYRNEAATPRNFRRKTEKVCWNFVGWKQRIMAYYTPKRCITPWKCSGEFSLKIGRNWAPKGRQRIAGTNHDLSGGNC